MAVYSKYLNSWSQVPVARARPPRFDWSTVHLDPSKALPRFGNWSPRDQATQEQAWREESERRRREESERRRREDSERRRREESERRRREESEERRRREESERRRREEEERRGRRGHQNNERHHRGGNSEGSSYWTWSESRQRYYHRHSDGSRTWQ